MRSGATAERAADPAGRRRRRDAASRAEADHRSHSGELARNSTVEQSADGRVTESEQRFQRRRRLHLSTKAAVCSADSVTSSTMLIFKNAKKENLDRSTVRLPSPFPPFTSSKSRLRCRRSVLPAPVYACPQMLHAPGYGPSSRYCRWRAGGSAPRRRFYNFLAVQDAAVY